MPVWAIPFQPIIIPNICNLLTIFFNTDICHAPKRAKWLSGKPADIADIAERPKQTATAIDEHTEIAPHGYGHFDGRQYSTVMWASEFSQFNAIMAHVWKHYGDGAEPVGWSDYFSKPEHADFRAPSHVGHHFAQWNGGAYWKAMQRFARAVCNSKTYSDVQCASYPELVKFMDDHGSEITAYQKGDFDKATPAQVSDMLRPAIAPIRLAKLHKAQPIDPAASYRN